MPAPWSTAEFVCLRLTSSFFHCSSMDYHCHTFLDNFENTWNFYRHYKCIHILACCTLPFLHVLHFLMSNWYIHLLIIIFNTVYPCHSALYLLIYLMFSSLVLLLRDPTIITIITMLWFSFQPNDSTELSSTCCLHKPIMFYWKLFFPAVLL